MGWVWEGVDCRPKMIKAHWQTRVPIWFRLTIFQTCYCDAEKALKGRVTQRLLRRLVHNEDMMEARMLQHGKYAS